MKFAFQIYDIDGDGLISADELYNIIKMMADQTTTDEMLRSLVEKTIS